MDSMRQPISRVGMTFEGRAAMLDQQAAAREIGRQVQINIRIESQVTRDLYGSVKKAAASSFITYANPFIDSPSKRQLEKAGLRESNDLIVKLPMQDFIDNGYPDLDQLDITRMTLSADGQQWKFRERSHDTHIADLAGVAVFGLGRA